MKEYLGTSILRRWRSCSQVCLLALAAFVVLSGCNLVGPVKTPYLRGAWEAEVIPVEVLDANGVEHTVAGLAVGQPLSVDASRRGYVVLSAEKGSGRDQYALIREFWSFSTADARVAFFTANDEELVPYKFLSGRDRLVIFSGELRYDTPPRLLGEDIVRLSKAATVADSRGTTRRTYTSSVDLVAIGMLGEKTNSE